MRILVVDDHDVVRRGICAVLAADPTFLICGEAVDGRDAVEKAKALRPDLVVMDISMPNMNGLEATREIKRSRPEVEIVIVSQHDAPEMVRQASSAGAGAYVTKSAISTDLLAAIEGVRERHPSIGEGKTAESTASDGPEAAERNAALEKALRESGDRFQAAMNHMAEGLCTIDARGRITYVNPSAQTLLGWTGSDLIGRNIHDVVHYRHPDGRSFPASDCPNFKALQDGAELRDREDTFLHKDGTFFPVVLSCSPLKSEGKTLGAVICFRDDTMRRTVDGALQQTEKIYRAIGESIDYGVWICDAQGRNIYSSASFLELIGVTQAQCSEFGWMQFLHPEDAEITKAAWKECVRLGKPWNREHRFRGVDGKWHYILARGTPIRGAQGTILYWAGINLDIQAQKETENQLLQLVQNLEAKVSERTRELQNAGDKLRELSGKLLLTQDEERRRIARELHDGVGQLLAELNMNLSKLDVEKGKLSPEARQSLDENTDLVDQASREIRTMSHLLHPPLLDEVGLDSALRWYVDGFSERSSIDVSMELDRDFGRGLPRDLALALFRIVQECLVNVHRHSGSSTAFVTFRHTPGNVTLEVRDQGQGIPEEIRQRISSGESSGVGLRGMRERIRQFGGHLEIQSDDNGTRIVAALPIPPQAEAPKDEARNGNKTVAPTVLDKPVPGAATVLCIDDEAAGLLPRKLLLESAGYRVIEARSGQEGIRLFQSERVDVVILDYWMSGMKGTVVASELKSIDPTVPIIVLSGLSDLPGEAAGLVDQWLVKGSTRAEQLLDSINGLLERRPA